MRIAFVTPEYITESYFCGGLANLTYRWARGFAERGHEVHVVTLSDQEPKEFEAEGVQVHRVHRGYWLPRLMQLLTGHRIPRTSEWLDFGWQACKRVWKLHRAVSLDVIQYYNYMTGGLFLQMLVPVPQVNMLSSYRPMIHEKASVVESLDTRMMAWLESLQIRMGKHIFAPSETLKKIVASQLGIDHIQVIRPPFYIEVDELDPTEYRERLEGKEYLLYFGRLERVKGVHILGEALPVVFRQFPHLLAVFVGLDKSAPDGGSMREYVRRCCSTLSDRLVFIEPLPHSKLYPIIQGARLVVLPSLTDNLPNTLLEAMGLGKAVVGTRGCSFDELIEHGVSGFLAKPGNAEDLSRVIIEALSFYQLDKIGNAAQRVASSMRPERTLSDLERYFKSIVDKQQLRRLMI